MRIISHFTTHPLPMEINSIEELENTVENLMNGMKAILQEIVPLSTRKEGYKKQWWTRELLTKHKELKCLQHRASRWNASSDDKQMAASANSKAVHESTCGSLGSGLA